MAYVTADFLRSYGILDQSAVDWIEWASSIIDAHVNPRWPRNSDGHVFPRVKDYQAGIFTDDASVPLPVQRATAEQIAWVMENGPTKLRKGGNDAIIQTTFGGSKQRTAAPYPLLAPLARAHLRPFMSRA